MNYRKTFFLLITGTSLALFWACGGLIENRDIPAINDSANSTSGSRVQGDALPYYDLETYFNAQIEALTKKNPLVKKEIEVDGEREVKTIHIQNWNHELDPFFNSAINKPAWRTSYAIDSSKNQYTYTALEDDLKTRKIVIDFDENGGVAKVMIWNETDNMIYTTQEELTFYPDSLYEIVHHQQVRVLGKHSFKLVGHIQ
jgi:uncharacterized protein YuzE